MKREKSDAIVIQTWPSRERDKLVVFVTPTRGKMKGWAYGARSAKNRFGAALEPLARIRIDYAWKENDDTVRIESASLVRSMFSLQQNLSSSLALTYIAETIDVFAQSDEPSELLFRLLDSTSEALLDGASPVLAIAYVEIWVLKLGGLFPSIRSCIECGSTLELPLQYDHERSGFLCSNCADSSAEKLPNDISRALQRILGKSPTDIADEEVSEEALFGVRQFAARLRREFLGHELKSYDLLQTVLKV